jgi:hypothetical protein
MSEKKSGVHPGVSGSENHYTFAFVLQAGGINVFFVVFYTEPNAIRSLLNVRHQKHGSGAT